MKRDNDLYNINNFYGYKCYNKEGNLYYFMKQNSSRDYMTIVATIEDLRSNDIDYMLKNNYTRSMDYLKSYLKKTLDK